MSNRMDIEHTGKSCSRMVLYMSSLSGMMNWKYSLRNVVISSMLDMHAADWLLQWISWTGLTSALNYEAITDGQCAAARKLGI